MLLRRSCNAALRLFSLLLILSCVLSEASDDNPVTSRFKCTRSGCCDQHEWCRFWASVGECKTNEEWMTDNCQLACATCRKSTASAASASPKRRPSPSRPPPPRRRPATRRRPVTQTTAALSSLSVQTSRRRFTAPPQHAAVQRQRGFASASARKNTPPRPAILPAPSNHRQSSKELDLREEHEQRKELSRTNAQKAPTSAEERIRSHASIRPSASQKRTGLQRRFGVSRHLMTGDNKLTPHLPTADVLFPATTSLTTPVPSPPPSSKSSTKIRFPSQVTVLSSLITTQPQNTNPRPTLPFQRISQAATLPPPLSQPSNNNFFVPPPKTQRPELAASRLNNARGLAFRNRQRLNLSRNNARTHNFFASSHSAESGLERVRFPSTQTVQQQVTLPQTLESRTTPSFRFIQSREFSSRERVRVPSSQENFSRERQSQIASSSRVTSLSTSPITRRFLFSTSTPDPTTTTLPTTTTTPTTTTSTTTTPTTTSTSTTTTTPTTTTFSTTTTTLTTTTTPTTTTTTTTTTPATTTTPTTTTTTTTTTTPTEAPITGAFFGRNIEATTASSLQQPPPTESSSISTTPGTSSTFSTVRPNVVQFRTRVTRPPQRRRFQTTTMTTTTTTPATTTTQHQSGRTELDLDTIIRSNLANACVPRNDQAECERSLCYNLYFRTFDGTCNNFANPLQGSAYRPYNRLIAPEYDDTVSEPIGSRRPHIRPNPREVTKKLISSPEVVLSTEFNALLMQFGQFLSHDVAKTTLVPSSKCNVCQNITSRCMSVDVDRSDPNRDFVDNKCIRVSRSSPICGSGNRLPRQQLNENSGYIDASPIYGSSLKDSKKFRNGNTGFLRMSTFNGMQALPFDTTKCRRQGDCTVIFTAGDSRVNLFVGLGTFHIVMTKEHNRIASTLQRFNPHWNGDRLFMETRKIMGAQVQAIVYREYLPKILGAAFATHVGEYQGYDPNEDATLVNEFTSAAFRFGHGMIQDFYARLDERFSNTSFGPMELTHGTLHSDTLIFEGGVDPVIRGMLTQRVKRPQRVTPTVTEKMFGSTDLSTINIQRGRDHAHAPYVRFRELCGLGRANNFDHLSREILTTGVRERLREVYGRVDAIDLWVGGLLEDPVVRGLVGPTIACIIGPQFKRSRDGDRFYYENPGVFTRAQLAEIRRSSLSRIICDNVATIDSVPREAFRIGRMTPCSQIPRMDLSKWKE